MTEKNPRELAARALCRSAGNPENTKFEGNPMWQSYLPEADAVLEAIKWHDAEKALTAAYHALRSYECGNGSTQLAKSIANECAKMLRLPQSN